MHAAYRVGSFPRDLKNEKPGDPVFHLKKRGDPVFHLKKRGDPVFHFKTMRSALRTFLLSKNLVIIVFHTPPGRYRNLVT